MPRAKIIVNPLAGRGYGAQASPLIERHLHELSVTYDLVQTRYAGEATELARQAADDGYDAVVAVGGDGTSHEVVNGIMGARRDRGAMPHSSALGCIPAGSGNDFAMMNGAPRDLRAACELIAGGLTRLVDVGQVTIDDRAPKYFGNAVGVGFDALVTIETRKLGKLRGLALYLPAVLRTIFSTLQPMHMEITCDQERFHRTTLVTIVANGPREGGGFFVAPDARTDDGLLDLVLADEMSRLSMLGMVPRFMKGTHTHHPLITMRRSARIEISSPDPLFVHIDGELPGGEAHHIVTQVLPRSLRMIAPPTRKA